MRLGQGRAPTDALVFGTPEGHPWPPDYLTDSFSRALATAGLPHVTLHTLRHTHASMLIKAGEDIITISRRLGHASPTVTLNVYGHLVSSRDGAAAAVQAMLRGDVKW